jgi:hypothetical protein
MASFLCEIDTLCGEDPCEIKNAPLRVRMVRPAKRINASTEWRGYMSWQESIRLLWTGHLVWIRQFLISLIYRLRDLSYVKIRTIQNAVDFSNQLTPFYGLDNAKLYETLLTERVLLLSELATTIRSGSDISIQLSKLQKNAEDTSTLFSSLNPYWNKSTWQEMFSHQYQLEEQLIRQISEGSLSMTISTYDAIYQNALKMAAYMINGITSQFPQYAYPTGVVQAVTSKKRAE